MLPRNFVRWFTECKCIPNKESTCMFMSVGGCVGCSWWKNICGGNMWWEYLSALLQKESSKMLWWNHGYVFLKSFMKFCSVKTTIFFYAQCISIYRFQNTEHIQMAQLLERKVDEIERKVLFTWLRPTNVQMQYDMSDSWLSWIASPDWHCF